MLLALGVLTVIGGAALFLTGGHYWSDKDRMGGLALMVISVLVIGGGFALMVDYGINQLR